MISFLGGRPEIPLQAYLKIYLVVCLGGINVQDKYTVIQESENEEFHNTLSRNKIEKKTKSEK